MLFDSLVHATPDGRWFGTAFDASLATLLRQMDAAGVERAMMVGLAEFVDNKFVEHCISSHPERFCGGAGFNPIAYPSAAEMSSALDREVIDRGFRAIKLHPRMNGYDLSDSRCGMLFEGLTNRAHPPLIWLDTFLYRPNAVLSGDPVRLIHSLAVKWPRLTFVCCHSAGPLALQLAEAVRFCPNVFLDLSYTLARFQGFSFLSDLAVLAHRFDRRLIWGSDFPEVSIPDTVNMLERFMDGLEPAQAERIRSQNLRELLLGGFERSE